MNNLTNILCCLVGGIPHSGTTIIKDAICKIPNIESGFECGLLLSDSPKTYKQNLYNMVYNYMAGWEVEDHLTEICDTDSFYESYCRLRKYSPVIKNKQCRLVDKAPHYVYCVKDINKRTTIPIIITYKDIRNQCKSLIYRGGVDPNHYLSFYDEEYFNFLKQRPNVLLIKFEKFLDDPKKKFQKISSFLNINYSLTDKDIKELSLVKEKIHAYKEKIDENEFLQSLKHRYNNPDFFVADTL